jgi:hypothetical protein
MNNTTTTHPVIPAAMSIAAEMSCSNNVVAELGFDGAIPPERPVR